MVTVGVRMIHCLKCDQEMQYDEGEGNYADGYTCYECINNNGAELNG